VLADYFVVRRLLGLHSATLVDQPPGWQWSGMVSWLAGVVIYQTITQLAPQIGASIPAFLITFVMYTALRLVQRQRLLRTAS
jgi:purine-cytosine permease-like protein